MDALTAISVPQPQFPAGDVRAVLQSQYGLSGELRPLLSERDQNYRLSTATGAQFVVKIANRAEPAVATDFQIKALLHVAAQSCRVATPQVARTRAGLDMTTIGAGGNRHCFRVVSYLPGQLLSNTTMTPRLALDFGAATAALDRAMRQFRHAGEAQQLLWDLQQASKLRGLLKHIAEPALQQTVAGCIDDFDARVLPRLAELRRQVIHSDLNSDNVLSDGAAVITGVIDFGDMVYAPLIMEVAVAASYLRPPASEPDALAWVAPFVAAYHTTTALTATELALLYDLLRARLAATISILRWRAATRGAGDQYSSEFLTGENDAEVFLQRLNRLGRRGFLERLENTL